MIPQIGQILVRRKALSQEDLAGALALQEQQIPGKRIGQLLVESGHISEGDVGKALAEQWGYPYVEQIAAESIGAELLQHLPIEFLRKHGVLPFYREPGALAIAVVDPTDTMAIDSVVNRMGGACVRVLAPRPAIEAGLSQYYYHDGDPAGQSDLEADERLQSVSGETYTEDLLDLSKGAPIIKLVNAFLFQASQSRASDIHVEPYEHDVKVRFRIDGVLYTRSTFPKQYFAAMVSRLKIMAKLNIAERRLPQDGRSRIKIGDRELDTRVSTIPTAWGERVVLRLLDESGARFGLGQLGFEAQTEKQFRSLIARPHGIILLTGPTGSGKTTTLYGAITELNRDDRNIMTVEDPIEYRLAGVSQTQVMPKIGLTFAACLRHILRQDPDVIMIGEIRDLETARIAIQAALTGHLVFSTLHTNDAASAVTRLVDMGIEPYLVSSSLLAIMAQRLVRRVCPQCKGVSEIQGDPDLSLAANGCSNCSGTGYRGRMGIFELLVLEDEIRELILTDARAHRIRQAAMKKGMRTLREDGQGKVSRGLTTAEEVLRVTQEDSD
ncbi:MAG: type II secretion system ATPase GspE [Sedimentisphaerales bacterium]|nr:type II secretion system ATPase GspE [Sedimentisphaerales bacterium]